MNIGHTYENTARLIHAVRDEYPSAGDLPLAYRDAISSPQQRSIPVNGEGLSISYEDGEWSKFCIQNGIFENIFKGSTPTDTEARATWHAKVTEALEHIQDISPDLRRMVDLLVTDLVVLNSGADGGGSASHMPGIVIMSPSPTWDIPDYAMCLVHEAMHLNLFVGDKVYRTFNRPSSELDSPEYYVLSAVKIGQQRPLDKAFHAAIVTIPLLFMEYRRGLDLGPSGTGSFPLRESCEDLKKHRDVFTDYGKMLLDELCSFVEDANFEFVARTISSPEYAGYRPNVAV
ncbi:aKG-HExxH-type peptide beta-hydroxylase [Streptomyces sp. NPDC055099]